MVDEEEQTPLLSAEDESEEELKSPIEYRKILEESKVLLSLALPVIGGYLISYVNAPVLTLGHLGTNYLAAISLTTMTANITGFSVGQGLATALDTLCSQAFTGAEDKKVLGCHLQRSIVVMAIITVPILVLWSYTESILILLGQDPEISRLSGTFIKYLSPGLFPYLVYSCVLRYLQAQNIMKASLYIMLASAPVNIFLQWFLVWSPYGFGAIGAPMATSITNMLLPILLIIYAARYEGYECWGGWNWKEALDLRQLGYFWSLGIPGVAMICSEWWAFEVVALMAGLIGEKYTLTITSRHLAAQSIVLNTGSLCFMVPLGLSVGTSTRVGNSLGAKKPFIARNASISAFFLALMFASLNCTMLLLAKDVWGYLYTQDETVVRLVSEVLPLAAFFQVNDGLSAVASGILRGWYNLYLKVSGRQALGAALNLTGYYALGLPLGILFTFTLRFGLLGIWLGLTIGITFVAYIGLYIICYKTDWPEQSRNALKLLKAHNSSNLDEFSTTDDGEDCAV